MSSRLLFIGAGAIGSYLGGFLSRAGNDVTLVDPSYTPVVQKKDERIMSVGSEIKIEHGVTLCSTDGDFGRFIDLRWQNPLAGAGS